MKIFSLSFIIASLFILSSNCLAQSGNRDAVILINGVASKVIINENGDIVEKVKELKNYIPHASQSQTMRQILEANPEYKFSDKKNQLLVFSKDEENKKRKQQIEDGALNLSGIANNRKREHAGLFEFFEGPRIVYFNPRNAALNDEAIDKLNEIILYLSANKDSHVRLIQINSDNEYLDKLAENRINVIIEYLEFKNIAKFQYKVERKTGAATNRVELLLEKISK